MPQLHEPTPRHVIPIFDFVSSNERRFFAWVCQAEDMLGHGLDGDQSADGYSLDYARTAFDEEWSVVEYVLTVKAAIEDRKVA